MPYVEAPTNCPDEAEFQFCCGTLWQALWDRPKRNIYLGTELLPSKQDNSQNPSGERRPHNCEDKAFLAQT